jgi:hypothetical protein
MLLISGRLQGLYIDLDANIKWQPDYLQFSFGMSTSLWPSILSFLPQISAVVHIDDSLVFKFTVSRIQFPAVQFRLM